MIAMTAATGRVGRQLLDSLLRSGESLRIVARDPSRLPAHARDHAEVIQGSHEDVEVLRRAFAGVDSVFWLVPPDPKTTDVDEHYRRFTRSACTALRENEVARVVAVSSLGRDWRGDAGLLSAAFAMDDLLECSGVSYRALRMPFFMENLLGQAESVALRGTFALGNRAHRPLATVAARDVAHAAAELLLQTSWSGTGSAAVIGSRNLSPHHMAQVMSVVLQRSVDYREVDPPALRTTLTGRGVSDTWAEGVLAMTAAQNDGIYEAECQASPLTAATGFREWCETELKPAVDAVDERSDRLDDTRSEGEVDDNG